MKTKSLIETNPYLRDAATREKLVTNSVVTSCGVEGVKVNFNQATKVKATIKAMRDADKRKTHEAKNVDELFKDLLFS